MQRIYWDVIKQNGSTHAVFEITKGCVYDPEISRLIDNPAELRGFCENLAAKRWANESVVEEFRQIVGQQTRVNQ